MAVGQFAVSLSLEGCGESTRLTLYRVFGPIRIIVRHAPRPALHRFGVPRKQRDGHGNTVARLLAKYEKNNTMGV